VSGGAWAATPYTFIAGQRANFLESYVPPDQLGSCNLKTKPGAFTHTVANARVTIKGLGYLARLQGSKSYGRVISDRFLDGFALGEHDRWFTWSEETAERIICANPSLKDTAYYTVPQGRPFLIVGGTLRYYDWLPWKYTSLPEKRVPVEYTPLYSGIRMSVPPGDYNDQPLGGGYVESFAYDTLAPKKTAPGSVQTWCYRKFPFQTQPLFTLGDVVGSTGSAPGEFALATKLFGLPTFSHWSPEEVDAARYHKPKRYAHEDGGLSENLGIMPLLARKVERIIAFVNARDVTRVGDGASIFPDYIEGLFGRSYMNMYDVTQVFESGTLDDIAVQVETSIRAGGAAIASTSLKVKNNSRFGVESYGNKEVKIFWVFLNAKLGGSHISSSYNWIKQIPPGTAARNFLNGRHKQFANFPTYCTGFENKGLRLWDVIDLTDEQATLLAHYTAWIIKSSKAKILTFLK
jgi:hypothetical protein